MAPADVTRSQRASASRAGSHARSVRSAASRFNAGTSIWRKTERCAGNRDDHLHHPPGTAKPPLRAGSRPRALRVEQDAVADTPSGKRRRADPRDACRERRASNGPRVRGRRRCRARGGSKRRRFMALLPLRRRAAIFVYTLKTISACATPVGAERSATSASRRAPDPTAYRPYRNAPICAVEPLTVMRTACTSYGVSLYFSLRRIDPRDAVTAQPERSALAEPASPSPRLMRDR